MDRSKCEYTVFRRGGFGSLNTKRSKITIGSPTVDNWRSIYTSSHGSIGFTKRDLQKKEK